MKLLGTTLSLIALLPCAFSALPDKEDVRVIYESHGRVMEQTREAINELGDAHWGTIDDTVGFLGVTRTALATLKKEGKFEKANELYREVFTLAARILYQEWDAILALYEANFKLGGGLSQDKLDKVSRIGTWLARFGVIANSMDERGEQHQAEQSPEEENEENADLRTPEFGGREEIRDEEMREQQIAEQEIAEHTNTERAILEQEPVYEMPEQPAFLTRQFSGPAYQFNHEENGGDDYGSPALDNAEWNEENDSGFKFNRDNLMGNGGFFKDDEQ